MVRAISRVGYRGQQGDWPSFFCTGKQDHPLDVINLTPLRMAYSKAIYGHLRSFTEGFRKASEIIRLIRGENGLEDWTKFVRKFDPQNFEVDPTQLELIVHFGMRNAVKSLGDISTILDQFRRVLDDYEEATGGPGINDSAHSRP